jgi:hypothetical protein
MFRVWIWHFYIADFCGVDKIQIRPETGWSPNIRALGIHFALFVYRMATSGNNLDYLNNFQSSQFRVWIMDERVPKLIRSGRKFISALKLRLVLSF